MANAFWGVTGFFIVLEIAFAMAVLFSGGTKDDKQCVPPFIVVALWDSSLSHSALKHYAATLRACTHTPTNCRLRYLLTTLTVACCWLL